MTNRLSNALTDVAFKLDGAEVVVERAGAVTTLAEGRLHRNGSKLVGPAEQAEVTVTVAGSTIGRLSVRI